MNPRQLLVKKLSIKSYCSRELREWLKEKGVDETLSDQLIQEFQALGYIDDATWVESFIRQQRGRRYGNRVIALKLMQKGFSEEEIDAVLGDESEETIVHLLQTRYRSRNLKDLRERQKVVTALMRRGFSLELIISTLKTNRSLQDF